MEKTGPYVYGNVAENKYVLIFFGKRTYFSCLMKNMMDLDRERDEYGWPVSRRTT